MKIQINNKEYSVKEAKTEEEKRIGLQNTPKLEDNEGMLFYYDPPEDVSFWMKGVHYPLDIIFINEDLEVIAVYKGKPNNENLITVKNVSYVLEVNQNSGIKEGDELEFPDEKGPVMKVLFPDGSTQMELWGGERIFRRNFTKLLIKWVKKADLVKDDEDEYNKICKTIGKKMFRELNAQDNRKPEYVTKKD